MATPIIIGSLATAKVIQTAVVCMVFGKMNKARKFKRKEEFKSWKITQFLEESRCVK